MQAQFQVTVNVQTIDQLKAVEQVLSSVPNVTNVIDTVSLLGPYPFVVLDALDRLKKVTSRDIVIEIERPRSTVRVALSDLVKNGLARMVVRGCIGKGRKPSVFEITERGREILRQRKYQIET